MNNVEKNIERIILTFIAIVMTTFFVSFVFVSVIQNNKQNDIMALYQDISDKCLIMPNIANKWKN